MEGKNPCDVCKRKDWSSGCSGCVLDYSSMQYECANDECMLNYECGCLIGLDEVCKASNCYQDEFRDHDCSECIHYTEKEDEDGVTYYTCGEDGAQIGRYDDACENFEENMG